MRYVVLTLILWPILSAVLTPYPSWYGKVKEGQTVRVLTGKAHYTGEVTEVNANWITVVTGKQETIHRFFPGQVKQVKLLPKPRS